MFRALALGLGLALGASAALASSPNWNEHAQTDTVVILTADEDGAARETTIWLAVLEGQGYVRGGRGAWVGNARRDPNVSLRLDGADYTLRAEPVTDAAELERVNAVFRAKYGFSDTLAGWIRGAPTVFRLLAREP